MNVRIMLLFAGLSISALAQSTEEPPPPPPPEFPRSAAMHVVGDHVLLVGQLALAVGLVPATEGFSLYVGAVTITYTVESLQANKRELERYRKARKQWDEEVRHWRERNPGRPLPPYGVLWDFDDSLFGAVVDYGFDLQVAEHNLWEAYNVGQN